MKLKEYTIWTNNPYDIDIDDYDDDFYEWYGNDAEEMTDDEKWECCMDYVYSCRDDEVVNLDIPLGAEVIAIADLGLWNGRVHGAYRVLGRNVNEIFNVNEEYNRYKCDRYNVRAECTHHDGTNYILFRKFRDGLSEWQKDEFLDKLYNHEATERTIRRYTESLTPYVSEVYGWFTK